ncbi:hypothetical protein GJA_3066 [Janthinobacterium agaricidamnosum NBRC 102515 = DSM 9628]|uniref:Uncharacterized protein n=2 Tax=Janthinobacterium agaricidamnosum TaxID=55508 RepID=W0V8U1_9BURK|nr:hypothetical protein GJA_3066 [Janthinobacterium agaricidamnosum NBRC 102515 = DSM 9628]
MKKMTAKNSSGEVEHQQRAGYPEGRWKEDGATVFIQAPWNDVQTWGDLNQRCVVVFI